MPSLLLSSSQDENGKPLSNEIGMDLKGYPQSGWEFPGACLEEVQKHPGTLSEQVSGRFNRGRVHAKGVVLYERTCVCLLSTF